MNLTKIQAKIGMEYYPSIPALANGGNVMPLVNNSNFQFQRPNNEYLINLYQTFGKYNNLNDECFVNPVNFAINDRVYSPDNYLGQTGTDSNGYTYQEVFNQYGWPLVHENRCVGRAVYALDFETLPSKASFTSGVNTTNIKPFDMNMEYQSDATFNRPSMGYPYCWYDMILAVTTAGITVVGRS